jgi:hypothetical protein
MSLNAVLKLKICRTTAIGLFFCLSIANFTFGQKDKSPKTANHFRVKVRGGQALKINKDSLFIHYKDTVLLIPKGTRYEFVDNKPKSNQGFYDTLKTKYGHHKVTDLLLSTLLVNTDTSGRQIKKQAFVQSEQSFIPYKGLIIDQIILKKVPVISGSVYDTTRQTTTWAGRAIDKAHIYSKDRIILNNLLFEAGDQISPFIMADNERLLRSLRFIEDAKIIVTTDPITSLATITVITKDVWSVGGTVDVGGIDEFGVEVYDRNFLGQGSELSNSALVNTNEAPLIGYEGRYTVNNISGTFINSFFQFKTVYDEKIIRLKFDKLFLTPQVKYAGGIDVVKRTFTDAEVWINDEIDFKNITYNRQEIWAGKSITLPTKAQRSNIIFSVAYVNTDFIERPAITRNEFFKYHDQRLYLGKVSFTKRNYYEGNFVNRFGITEDIPVGTFVSLTKGREVGEFKNRTYHGISYILRKVTGRTEYWTSSLSLSAFTNQNRIEDGLFNASIVYFSKLMNFSGGYKTRFQTRLFYTKGFDRANDETLIIFEEKGIRGFDEGNLTGTERLSIKVEGDIITPWNFYGFRFIPYAFVDVGLINHFNVNILSRKNFFSGFGLGIRIRNESLVFSTFEFRFAYYPKIYEQDAPYGFDFFTDSPYSFQDLNEAKPQIERLK